MKRSPISDDVRALNPELADLLTPAKQNKFGNEPQVVDGIRFDSKAEAERYSELLLLQKAGTISDLQVHPRFVIVAASGHGPDLYYESDFSYIEQGKEVVEDVKASSGITQTALFKLKARLFRERYLTYELRVVER